METVLSVEHLMISFSQYERGWRKIQLPVIRDLSINVKGHEIVAVVGSSGSGKSLLAHAVMGLLPANASWKGRITFKGEELTGKRVKADGAGTSECFLSGPAYEGWGPGEERA